MHLPQVVKLGSYKAVEIPLSKIKKKKGGGKELKKKLWFGPSSGL